MNKFNTILKISFFTYISFLLIAFLIGFKEEIPQYMFILQLCIAMFFFSILYLCTRLESMRDIMFVLPFIFGLLSFVLRYVFIEYTGDSYNNTNNCDAYTYEIFTLRGQGVDYFTFLKVVLWKFDVDDMGYSTISYFAHSFSNEVTVGRILLLLLNVLAISISAVYIYKICQYVQIEKRLSMVFAAFYGCFPFFIVSSAMGLKENSFCFIIVAALYYMFKYQNSRRLVWLLWALLFVFLTFFFRKAVTLMLSLTFVPLICCNDNNKKKSIYWGIAGVLFVGGILPTLILNFTGISMEHVSRVTEARLQGIGGSVIQQWMSQFLGAFLGPFPNFTRTVSYGILHNSGLLLKCIMGYFTYTGIYQVFKQLDYKLYPIVAYLLMGYMMLIMSGVALDMRYHVTFFPAVVILAANGMQYAPHSIKSLFVYYFVLIGIIMFYNLR